ncbi:MAG TPA: efflux RND transporter periplasmic adaptor subunit, partial [bacterium]|nr:efflux RND transporter periplasmic adaptor subunit [bacterium]
SIVPGTEVAMVVDTLGGAEYTGKIVTQSPVVDDRTRTANVELEVENADGRLRHGMFGRMKLVVERRDDVLSVPLGSVSWEGEKTIVYRLEGGEVRRVEVKPGLRNSSKVEIAGGVSEGDRVVVGGLIDLENGEKVEVRGREAGNGERGGGAK